MELVRRFIEIVHELRPKYWVMENVPGMLPDLLAEMAGDVFKHQVGHVQISRREVLDASVVRRSTGQEEALLGGVCHASGAPQSQSTDCPLPERRDLRRFPPHHSVPMSNRRRSETQSIQDCRSRHPSSVTTSKTRGGAFHGPNSTACGTGRNQTPCTVGCRFLTPSIVRVEPSPRRALGALVRLSLSEMTGAAPERCGPSR